MEIYEELDIIVDIKRRILEMLGYLIKIDKDKVVSMIINR